MNYFFVSGKHLFEISIKWVEGSKEPLEAKVYSDLVQITPPTEEKLLVEILKSLKISFTRDTKELKEGVSILITKGN